MSTAIPAAWTYTNDGVRKQKLYSLTTGQLESTNFTYNVQRQATYLGRETVSSPKGWTKRAIKPFNPFYFIKAKDVNSYGFVTFVDKATGKLREESTGCFHSTSFAVPEPVTPAIPQAEKDSMDRQARTKVRLKLKDESVNFATVFAERDQSWNMISESATKLANTLRNLKRGNLREAAGALGVSVSNRKEQAFRKDFKKHQSKAVANGWLELNYGWLPLLDDARGTAEALAKIQDESITGRAIAVVRRDATTANKGVNTSNVYPVPFVENVTEQHTVKYVVFYSTSLSVLRNAGSLGLTNPFTVAWELLPWSFAIDWFLPIGDWIASWDATLGLSFAGGSVTNFNRSERLRTEEVNRVLDGDAYRTSRVQTSRSRVECRRGLLTTFPEVALPSFENPLGYRRVLNALALLRQQHR